MNVMSSVFGVFFMRASSRHDLTDGAFFLSSCQMCAVDGVAAFRSGEELLIGAIFVFSRRSGVPDTFVFRRDVSIFGAILAFSRDFKQGFLGVMLSLRVHYERVLCV
jgi:hypothetical protein